MRKHDNLENFFIRLLTLNASIAAIMSSPLGALSPSRRPANP